MSNARLIAAQLLSDIERSGSYSNIALSASLKSSGLSKLDSAFVSSVVYGVLQRKITIDAVIDYFSDGGVRKTHPFVVAVLRTGIYQLVFMDKIPVSAAVNESVNIIKHSKQRFAVGFVNALLRKVSVNKNAILDRIANSDDLSVKYSCDQSFIDSLISDYGNETSEAFLREALLPPEIYARVNTAKSDLESIVNALEKQGIICKNVGINGAFSISGMGNIKNIKEFSDGLFFIQDLSSQIAIASLDISPGMNVLDLCAAPGGKSFTAAQYLGGKGLVYSCDIYEQRTGLIKSGAIRLGLRNIFTAVNDATVFNPELGEFDRIICDVPCSGYGVIRRKPEIRYKSVDTFENLPELQLKILDIASEYLAVGGKIMYSTCTLRRAENENVVAGFLERHHDFEIVTQRTLMPQKDNCDGFYYCVIKRK